MLVLRGLLFAESDWLNSTAFLKTTFALNNNCAASQAALQLECQKGTNAKAELLHKWDMITSFQKQNTAMDDLIKLLFKENMVNKQRWEAAAADMKQFLSDQFVPAMDQVSKETNAMHDWMMREQAAFAQLELHQLPTYCAHGEVICITEQPDTQDSMWSTYVGKFSKCMQSCVVRLPT